ncbi:hypothetical protein JL721_12503 [Aureococcus anophagefferens]|nr:hypothetical protein JL721_12503 [Aureococcus anophagefferens]
MMMMAKLALLAVLGISTAFDRNDHGIHGEMIAVYGAPASGSPDDGSREHIIARYTPMAADGMSLDLKVPAYAEFVAARNISNVMPAQPRAGDFREPGNDENLTDVLGRYMLGGLLLSGLRYIEVPPSAPARGHAGAAEHAGPVRGPAANIDEGDISTSIYEGADLERLRGMGERTALIKKVRRLTDRIRRQMAKNATINGSWYKLFKNYDKNNSGDITFGKAPRRLQGARGVEARDARRGSCASSGACSTATATTP